MFFIAGIIPLLIGFIYYHEKVFGTKWMNVNGFSKEYLESGNMPLIMGVAYLMSVILSFGLSNIVIHQPNVVQMMIPEALEAGSSANETLKEIMAIYGDKHRNWQHGALHGAIFAIFLALPLISINALFERRGAAYIFIHFGYWLLTLTAVGALICATLQYPTL